ncbi:hypothetical protein [Streptomyces subrutilus]|uniref:hypothetical protein n=1 Tax=Streptomyces subrutilus TaxID=36818 RepID=UPI0033F0D721
MSTDRRRPLGTGPAPTLPDTPTAGPAQPTAARARIAAERLPDTPAPATAPPARIGGRRTLSTGPPRDAG